MRVFQRRAAGPVGFRASRILPIFVLLGSLLVPAGQARSATDAPTAFRLLGDLNPGPLGSYPPNNAQGDFEPGAHSGDKYFMPMQTLAGDPPDFELVELYVTSGRSDDGHLLAGFQIPSQISMKSGYGSGITAFGEGYVLFLGSNGLEDDLELPTDPNVALEPIVCPPLEPGESCPERYDPLEMRLFVTDGEQTELLRPDDPIAFPCLQNNGGDDPACGFYRISAGDDYRPEPPIAVTDSGIVFIGAWYDGSDLGTRIPYLIEGDASGYTVSPIDPASGLTGGNSLDGCCQLGIRSGQRIQAVGSVVFADLTDCAESGCLAGDGGRELYAVDLAAAHPTWRIASVTGLSFDSDFSLDVVGDLLYFSIGSGAQRGTYVGTYDDATGLTATKIGPPKGGGAGAVGSEWFYWARYPTNAQRSIMRSSAGGGAVALVTYQFPAIGGAASRIWSTGDAIYFGGAPSPTAVHDGIYRFEPGHDTAPVRIFATSVGPGDGLFGGAYDGNLFFTAGDPVPEQEPQQLFAYSGSGTPTMVTRINGSAAAGFRWFGQVDDLLVFWAEDGIHGYEPWVADVLEAPLTVAAVGSGSVTSDPPGIECPPTCTHLFRFGTAVTLNATDDGGTFARWTSNCAPGEDSAECTVVLDGPKGVAAVFAAIDDILAISASGPEEVPAAGIVEYTLAIGNVTSADVGPVTLTGTLTGATLDAARTPWCEQTGNGFTCTIASLPATTARVLKVFAIATPGGSADATFEVAPDIAFVDNNTATVSILAPLMLKELALATPVFRTADDSAGIIEFGLGDRFSIDVAAYSGQTLSGGSLPYSVVVRNAGTAGGATLHAGFAAASPGKISASGFTCRQDAEAAAGFIVSTTCRLGTVANGDQVVVPIIATAPTTAEGTIGVSAKFWVTYDGGPDADPSTDLSEFYGTSIFPRVPEGAQAIQASLPLTGRLGSTTVGSRGATALDPSGVALRLEPGFAGYVSTREVSQEPVTEGLGGVPSPFGCSAEPTYLAACLAFDVVVEQSVSPSDVFTMTFTYDASTLVDVETQRPLSVRNTSVFLSTDGGETYEEVPACPARSSAGTYTGTVPCVAGRSISRMGDASFIVLTSTGGLWKIGA